MHTYQLLDKKGRKKEAPGLLNQLGFGTGNVSVHAAPGIIDPMCCN